MTEWEKAQEWEEQWHSNCVNSLNEELKQIVYAEKMGLIRKPTSKTPYNYDLEGKSILDIGGGAYSLLLKCENFKKNREGDLGTSVIDPLMDKYPEWVIKRYETAGIVCKEMKGENLNTKSEVVFDECWIYNVLQHTDNPQKIIENALKASKVIRIFEWVEEPISDGHIHTLHKDELDKWLGGEGKTEQLNENGCIGLSYYGIFKGDNYV